ncbi:MAG: hypothetical protein HXY45_18875 [Syntrophaceae bacterium]|nr:hypothetical protein [Syntrophaceae bacterium]
MSHIGLWGRNVFDGVAVTVTWFAIPAAGTSPGLAAATAFPAFRPRRDILFAIGHCLIDFKADFTSPLGFETRDHGRAQALPNCT